MLFGKTPNYQVIFLHLLNKEEQRSCFNTWC